MGDDGQARPVPGEKLHEGSGGGAGVEHDGARRRNHLKGGLGDAPLLRRLRGFPAGQARFIRRGEVLGDRAAMDAAKHPVPFEQGEVTPHCFLGDGEA